MKLITFSDRQRNILKDLLVCRLNNYNRIYLEEGLDKPSSKRFKNYYIKSFNSALEKITSNSKGLYNSKDKTAFISCINEHYDNYYKQLQLPTLFSWLNISNQQRKIVEKLDDCKDILVKCGYYNQRKIFTPCDTEFRFGYYVSAIDKIKESDKVFLSKTGENDYYKVGFIYNNEEYVSFELKNKISLSSFQFSSIQKQLLQSAGSQRFSFVTSKPDAKRLLSCCEGKSYPKGVLDLVYALLN